MNGGMWKVAALTLILAGLIALNWWILPRNDRRNYEFFPNMVESVALNAQTAPLELEDGAVVDRRIPPGSVARGHMPLAYPATPEGAALAGEMLESPIADDDVTALTRGAFVFETFCTVCHGPAGLGDGPVTKRGVPPPPSLLLENALNMKDGQMYHVISVGQNNMAAYASQLSQTDRWNVIRYVRKLQAPPPAPAPEVAP